jgi:hypothetical protein
MRGARAQIVCLLPGPALWGRMQPRSGLARMMAYGRPCSAPAASSAPAVGLPAQMTVHLVAYLVACLAAYLATADTKNLVGNFWS